MTVKLSSHQATEMRRRRRLWAVTLIFALSALGYGGYWWSMVRGWARTNDAYVTGNVTPVQAQTQGSVTAVLVENTEYVHEGQVLVRLQGDRARVALQKARAHLGAVARRVKRMIHKVAEERAQVAALQARKAKLGHDLRRYRQAAPDQGVSAIKIQDTRDQITVLGYRMAAVRSRLAADRALVKEGTVGQNPLVRQAEAGYLDAWIHWCRVKVRAPISGFVAQREVYPGMLLQPGAHLLDIVPLDQIWVVANIKETEMARVRPGQRVRLSADYYGSRITYHGVVQGLAAGAGSAFSILPPENATGNYIHIVERVPVRIAIPAAQLRRHPLRPGLSMVARIAIDSPGRDIDAPLTVTPKRGYRTAIYARQLETGRRQAARIIQDNS